MNTISIDVRGYPEEKIRQLQQVIGRWKQEERIVVEGKLEIPIPHDDMKGQLIGRDGARRQSAAPHGGRSA